MAIGFCSGRGPMIGYLLREAPSASLAACYAQPSGSRRRRCATISSIKRKGGATALTAPARQPSGR
jgi:hypothetical protein